MELRLVEQLFTELRGSGRREMRNALTTASYLFLLKFLECWRTRTRRRGDGRAFDSGAGLRRERSSGPRTGWRSFRRRVRIAWPAPTSNPHMDGAQNALSSIPVHDLVPVLETVDALWEQSRTGRKQDTRRDL